MKDDGSWAEQASEFLIAVRGVVYHLFDDYSWERDDKRLYVTGSGGELALGALDALGAATSKTAEDAEKKVRKALTTAIKYDNMSGGEILAVIQR
jgi:20S proteasome alpha/beta subunit